MIVPIYIRVHFENVKLVSCCLACCSSLKCLKHHFNDFDHFYRLTYNLQTTSKYFNFIYIKLEVKIKKTVL